MVATFSRSGLLLRLKRQMYKIFQNFTRKYFCSSCQREIIQHWNENYSKLFHWWCFYESVCFNFFSCILFISFFKEIVRHFWHLCFVVYVSIITSDSIIYRWGIECLIGENYIRFDYKKEENNTIILNQCRF